MQIVLHARMSNGDRLVSDPLEGVTSLDGAKQLVDQITDPDASVTWLSFTADNHFVAVPIDEVVYFSLEAIPGGAQ